MCSDQAPAPDSRAEEGQGGLLESPPVLSFIKTTAIVMQTYFLYAEGPQSHP